jgi:spore coat polysaccharide biosynthesis predicted glycosyltransferase SpsG
MKQVSQMVQKIRKDASKGSIVESTLILESPIDISVSDQIDDSAEYKQKISEMGHGMVLSGSVVEVGCCRNCQEFEVEI